MSKILLVEDDVHVVNVFKTVLEREGFEVLVAATGQDGLSMVKSELPSLVILDIMLPGGMNGFDVLEDMKRAPDTAKIPVLILTNLDTEEEVAKKIGVADYLVKVNTSNAEVVKRVKSLVDRSHDT
jgi:DNA-binding response OmpR family regulator